jgi:hypothetical protein
MADVLGINLEDAVEAKLLRNERKYPVELAKGNAIKYDRRESGRSALIAHVRSEAEQYPGRARRGLPEG